MANTDVFYFEGLDDVLFALMTKKETVSTPPEYDEIVRLPIATKLKIKGNGSELEKWASSKMFRRVARETKHEIGLDHVGIPIEVMDELKGIVAASGVTFGKTMRVSCLTLHLGLSVMSKVVAKRPYGILRRNCLL